MCVGTLTSVLQLLEILKTLHDRNTLRVFDLYIFIQTLRSILIFLFPLGELTACVSINLNVFFLFIPNFWAVKTFRTLYYILYEFCVFFFYYFFRMVITFASFFIVPANKITTRSYLKKKICTKNVLK